MLQLGNLTAFSRPYARVPVKGKLPIGPMLASPDIASPLTLPLYFVTVLTSFRVRVTLNDTSPSLNLAFSIGTSFASFPKPGIEPVMKQPGPDLYQRAVVANVRSNVRHLTEAAPILSEMVKAGKLKVVGGVYDLATGKVTMV